MSELRVGASNTSGGVNAYRYVETVYFTSNGTFTKASYPWLRAIRVKCVGGGGGGGGCALTTASQTAIGTSAGGGSYSESFITDIAGLASSVTVTRGAGGSGGAAGANSGTVGGGSSFGSLVTTNGGGEGAGGIAFTPPGVNVPGLQGAVGTGDFAVSGNGAGLSLALSVDVAAVGTSGGSLLGGGRRGFNVFQSGLAGDPGELYGGGGTGAINAKSQSARAGGAGGNGIVIVELYA